MKKLNLILLFVLTISITMVATTIIYNPQKVEAFMNTEYNYRFKADEKLSNGYQVKVLGVGFSRDSALYIYTSTNAEAVVIAPKNAKSKVESIKLTLTVGGYSLNKLEPFIKELSATCKSTSCALQSGQTINGINFSTSLTLKAEIKFNNGFYTVYTSSIKKAQR